VLKRNDPKRAAMLLKQAEAAADERYRVYEDLATRDGSRFLPHWEDVT
jgi:pyruvate-ferredoxin/flavodoxin oxidoreductase